MNDDRSFAKAWDDAIARSTSLGAEQAVLGGVFLRPAMLDWLDLEPEVFHDPRNREVWFAMQNLHRRRAPVDELTVLGELERAGLADMVGREGYLGQLQLRVPTTDSVAHYAEDLKTLLTTRRLIRLAATIPSRVLAGEVGEELVDGVQLGLSELEPGRAQAGQTLAEVVRAEVRAAVEQSEQTAKGEHVAGIPTGIGVLDAKTGGLPIGVPSVAAARPGNGKSSLALSIAANAGRRGIRSHIVTYEDRSQVFGQRSLAQDSAVSVASIAARQLERADIRAVIAAAETAAHLSNVRIDHGHGLPVDRLCRMIRARKRTDGTRLVIVDYVQLIPPRPHERRLDRQERIRAAVTELAELCGQEGLAMLLLSQLNRDAEGQTPTLENLAGSGVFEEVGKLILALHPRDDDGWTQILVLKNSRGPTATLGVRWDRARCWIG